MNAYKGDKWAVVINEKENALVGGQLNAFRKILLDNSTFPFVALIVHDSDINPDGELKRIHLHAYIETQREMTKTAFLKDLTELLSCEKEQISVDPTNSETRIVQYLTHKNDPEKFQYPFAKISSTNAERLSQLYEAVYIPPQDLEKEFLAEVKKGTAISSLCDTYGLSYVNKFRGLVKDIQNEDESGLRYALAEATGRATLMQDFAKRFCDLCEDVFTRLNHCLTAQEKEKVDLKSQVEKWQDLAEQFGDY